MSKRKPATQTFADLVREPTWSEGARPEKGAHAARRGSYNHAGELFDPEARLLHPVRQDVSSEDARDRVAAGAVVAFESCGCGGDAPGCQVQWVTGPALDRLRRTVGPEYLADHSAPTWIDIWANESTEVVFAHGDLRWGDELG